MSAWQSFLNRLFREVEAFLSKVLKKLERSKSDGSFEQVYYSPLDPLFEGQQGPLEAASRAAVDSTTEGTTTEGSLPAAPAEGRALKEAMGRRGGHLSWGYLALPALLLVVGLIAYLQASSDDLQALGPNLSVILFLNFGVIVLLVLAFVVSRHLIKLMFDRRRNVLGSRLRMRLVAAFGGLTLIPTAAVFVLASGLLNQAIEGWVSSQTETARKASLTVARAYAEHLSSGVAKEMASLGQQLRRWGTESPRDKGTSGNLDELLKTLEQERRQGGFFSISLVRQNGERRVTASHAAASLEPFREPPLAAEAIKRALRGTPSVLTEDVGSGAFIRSYSAVSLLGEPLVLVGSFRVDPDVAQAFDQISSSVKEYEQLRLFKNPLKSGYILTLTMVTAMILFGVIWLAFYISKQIVGPVERLAKGTEAVARGNYDIAIDASGDDEIGYLVNSFNRMLADLRASRDEAAASRFFTDSILAYLAVGVIGIDLQGRVTTCNRAAQQLFGLDSEVIGCLLLEKLQPQAKEVLGALLEKLMYSEGVSRAEAEAPLKVLSQGRTLSVLCTVGKIIEQGGTWTGTLLLFDDITDLSQAQQMSAWREVARRVAHEIKNPLTPIQLSAQRLGRLFPDEPEVRESTDTIIENVDSIKRLANDFSKFARLPTAVFQKADLNALIEEILSSFAEKYPLVTFQFIPEERLVDLMLDREQIRRLIINLVDNAVLAILSEGAPENRTTPQKVSLRTSYDRKTRMVVIEVADSGPGIRPEHKSRIFEPYFTLREGGSGLGLAVVNSVVADHHGQIRVYDNAPRGTKFIIELPLTQKDVTQRKLNVGAHAADGV